MLFLFPLVIRAPRDVILLINITAGVSLRISLIMVLLEEIKYPAGDTLQLWGQPGTEKRHCLISGEEMLRAAVLKRLHLWILHLSSFHNWSFLQLKLKLRSLAVPKWFKSIKTFFWGGLKSKEMSSQWASSLRKSKDLDSNCNTLPSKLCDLAEVT